jgi:hypothetical protein
VSSWSNRGIRRSLALPLGMLGIVVGAALCWRIMITTGLSGDVWWQLATGQWMIAHHRLMTRDVFSYTVYGRTWITEEWGYALLLAGLVRWWGPVAFWILSAGVATLALVALTARLRRDGSGWTWTGILVLLVALSLAQFLRDRPQTVSYLLFAVELWLLARARTRPRTLWVFPPLLMVWANLHGSFLLGLLVLLLEALWATVPVTWGRLTATAPLPRRSIWLAFVGSLLLTLVNPHGTALIPYAYHVSSNPKIANYIGEWLSPNFHALSEMLVVAGPVVLTVLALAVRSGAVDWGDLVLAGGLLIATLQSARFMPYFDIAWAVFFGRLEKPVDLNRASPTVLTPILGAVLAAALLYGPTVPPGTPAHEPVAAASFVKRQGGRVFTRYRWGDYMIHIGVPVFIDGRTDLYTGTGVFGTYVKVRGLTINPDAVFNRYHVEWVVWPKGWSLSTYLLDDPMWHLVLSRGGALVFRRVPPAGSA